MRDDTPKQLSLFPPSSCPVTPGATDIEVAISNKEGIWDRLLPDVPLDADPWLSDIPNQLQLFESPIEEIRHGV